MSDDGGAASEIERLVALEDADDVAVDVTAVGVTASRPRFEPALSVDGITGAAYNPRRLSEEAFLRLQASIRRFGFVKPIIVNGSGIIVAGHQRTKAARAIGVETVPALVLGANVHVQDEIRFNLLHNSIEENGAVVVVPRAKGRTGYHWVTPEECTIADVGESAVRVNACYQLMVTYGEWGSVVAHPVSGRLLLNADYAVACIRMKLPLLVYYPAPRDADPLVQALSGEYGIYDASQVAATPYVQNVVQPDRLRVKDGKTAKQTHSATWRTVALPRLKEGMRVVDFGAGNADYAKRLRKQGHPIDWYEPFYMDRTNTRAAGSVFDIKGSVTQQREVAARIEKAGLYEMVMLDSVLNATSSDDYHEWVLRTCAALLEDDGFLCLGTRAIETEQDMMKMRRSSGARLQLTYMDETGRAINIRRGTLYTMKFHSPLTLVAELDRFFGEVAYIGQEGATHTAVASKPLPQRRGELTRALTEEFNPPYPPVGQSDQQYRHGRHERVVRAILAANEQRGRLLDDE